MIAGDRATEFAKQANGKVGHKFKHALRGFEMTMSEKVAKQLAADPSVSYVEQNRTVTANVTPAGHRASHHVQPAWMTWS